VVFAGAALVDFLLEIFNGHNFAAIGLALGGEKIRVRLHLLDLLADFLKRRKIHEHIRGASVLREQKGATALARTRGAVREVVAEFGHWNDVFAGFEVDHGRLLLLVC